MNRTNKAAIIGHYRNGASIELISIVTNTTWEEVQNIITFYITHNKHYKSEQNK